LKFSKSQSKQLFTRILFICSLKLRKRENWKRTMTAI
jgi:hypothetical protein